MSQKLALKHRYTAVFQGLFTGMEWTVYQDSKPIRTGVSENLSTALRDARKAYREFVRRPDSRISHVLCHRNRRFNPLLDIVL